MHLHLNPLGGLAGDMFCAALLDTSPELLTKLQQLLDGLEMPVPVKLSLSAAEGHLSGRRFKVEPLGGPGHEHHHHAYRDIRRLLAESGLPAGVKTRSQAMFRLLAEVEAEVHGVDIEGVHFHEVGNWDAIADIVSASALLEELRITSCSTDPLPLGGGRVRTAHGWLPVPAPATRLLMQGLPVVDDGVPGERVTPTGAAILKSLQPVSTGSYGGLTASGMGFGTRELEGIPNCLQALCLTDAHGGRSTTDFARDRISTINFEVDDQSPEDFAQAMDRLRALDGVLSVTSLQAIGKQGRPTQAVEILARGDVTQAVAWACFDETSTIGLRLAKVERLLLSRKQLDVELGERRYQVKQVQRPGGDSAKLESRELAEVSGYANRERLRRRVLDRLEEEQDE